MVEQSILLVEDNPSDVELTRRALARSGIANPLFVVEDGQEALDYLFCKGAWADRDPADTPVLILLDLKLPRIDGLEVLRRVKSHASLRRIPVVILTSSNEASDRAAGYDLGTNSYIRKPVEFEQFAEMIRQLGLYWLVINEKPPSG
jgi:CheY-like chemotaxis protein